MKLLVPKFTGSNCQVPICNGIPATSNQVCNGKGTCLDDNSCHCSDGWAGADCSLVVSSCGGIPFNDKSVCSGSGTCSESGCSCSLGHNGTLCEDFNCDHLNGCSGHGTCVGANNCECDDLWDGANCTVYNENVVRCGGISSTNWHVCNGFGQA